MKIHGIIALVGLAGACTMTDAPTDVAYVPQGEIAEALAGRSAGAPLACIPMNRVRNSRPVGDAILFEGAGDTLYLNRPAGGCSGLGMGRAIRTRTVSSSLCRGDIVTIYDPVSGFEHGGCGLSEFVPYRRPG